MIQVFQPTVGQEELDAVRRVFESNWLGKGKTTREFEEAFAAHLDVPPGRVSSISCATEGLFQVLQILKPDFTVLPAISFVGAGNAAVEAGSHMILCDVDTRTLNPRATDIRRALNSINGSAAVIVLHYGGVPCEDLEEIDDLISLRDETHLIEDCAGAIVSRYHGRRCGLFGRFGVWSFDAMKTITTGDGGMVHGYNPKDMYWLHQRTYLDMDSVSGQSSGRQQWWEFQSSGHGRRAITNDIASAIGIEQLRKLDSFVARRRAIWSMYNRLLEDCHEWLTLPPRIPLDVESSYTFYWVQTDHRDELAHYLREHGVYTTFRYWPLHRVYGVETPLPNSEWAADHTLLLPLHQGLSDADVEYVCEQVIAYGHERVAAAHAIAA